MINQSHLPGLRESQYQLCFWVNSALFGTLLICPPLPSAIANVISLDNSKSMNFPTLETDSTLD